MKEFPLIKDVKTMYGDSVMYLKADLTYGGPVHSASSTFDFPDEDELHPALIEALANNGREWLREVSNVVEYMKGKGYWV